MRPARVGLLVGGVHLLLVIVGGLIALGAAFGAHRPWANSAGEQVVIAVTFVLMAPLSVLNALLPREHAPGYPVIAVLLTSVLWGFVAYGIARWRQARPARVVPPAT
jgi:hypothetical protein